jgi:hypothetical protein
MNIGPNQGDQENSLLSSFLCLMPSITRADVRDRSSSSRCIICEPRSSVAGGKIGPINRSIPMKSQESTHHWSRFLLLLGNWMIQ